MNTRAQYIKAGIIHFFTYSLSDRNLSGNFSI